MTPRDALVLLLLFAAPAAARPEASAPAEGEPARDPAEEEPDPEAARREAVEAFLKEHASGPADAETARALRELGLLEESRVLGSDPPRLAFPIDLRDGRAWLVYQPGAGLFAARSGARGGLEYAPVALEDLSREGLRAAVVQGLDARDAGATPVPGSEQEALEGFERGLQEERVAALARWLGLEERVIAGSLHLGAETLDALFVQAVEQGARAKGREELVKRQPWAARLPEAAQDALVEAYLQSLPKRERRRIEKLKEDKLAELREATFGRFGEWLAEQDEVRTEPFSLRHTVKNGVASWLGFRTTEAGLRKDAEARAARFSVDGLADVRLRDEAGGEVLRYTRLSAPSGVYLQDPRSGAIYRARLGASGEVAGLGERAGRVTESTWAPALRLLGDAEDKAVYGGARPPAGSRYLVGSEDPVEVPADRLRPRGYKLGVNEEGESLTFYPVGSWQTRRSWRGRSSERFMESGTYLGQDGRFYRALPEGPRGPDGRRPERRFAAAAAPADLDLNLRRPSQEPSGGARASPSAVARWTDGSGYSYRRLADGRVEKYDWAGAPGGEARWRPADRLRDAVAESRRPARWKDPYGYAYRRMTDGSVQKYVWLEPPPRDPRRPRRAGWITLPPARALRCRPGYGCY